MVAGELASTLVVIPKTLLRDLYVATQRHQGEIKGLQLPCHLTHVCRVGRSQDFTWLTGCLLIQAATDDRRIVRNLASMIRFQARKTMPPGRAHREKAR